MLSPYLEVDLTRAWDSHLVATDASSVFGFGVAVAGCASELAKEIGRFADKSGTLVRLQRDDCFAESLKPREGKVLKIPLSKSAFHTVICSRAQCKAHSGTLEAHALLLGLKWVLRAPSRHGKRIPFLVDAKAVLGAAAKGRSSAPTLRNEIRRIGAHVLAGNLLLKLVYVPSEDNPEDAPSRGVV